MAPSSAGGAGVIGFHSKAGVLMVMYSLTELRTPTDTSRPLRVMLQSSPGVSSCSILVSRLRAAPVVILVGWSNLECSPRVNMSLHIYSLYWR